MAQNCQVFGTLTGLNGLYTLSPMPIHLVIDGYNLLGVRGGLRGDVEARREQLIRDLAGYRQRKGHPGTGGFDGRRARGPGGQGSTTGARQARSSRSGEAAES